MTDILEKIIAQKRLEVAARKAAAPARLLEKSPLFDRKIHSLRSSLENEKSAGVIAEFKRKSPSKGTINASVSVAEIAAGYEKAGASALSILTDEAFFGGSREDLEKARAAALTIPILRKDFVIDEHQILEARAIGADAILLLANVHKPLIIRQLAQFARSLDLDVLLEIHDEKELAAICPEVSAVGVNNRNLRDFSVSLDHSFHLGEHIPNDFLKVSESGLTDPATVNSLWRVGFRGFLIGEFFMRQTDPAAAAARLIDGILTLRRG